MKKKKMMVMSDDDDDDNDDDIAITASSISTRTIPTTARQQCFQLQTEVAEWYTQSPWLFLRSGNQPIRRIGTLWLKFVLDNTGQQTNLCVWRKVAETTSAQQNSLTQQQTLSSALLHQHKTGQEYYVTHNPQVRSKEVHNVWKALMIPVCCY